MIHSAMAPRVLQKECWLVAAAVETEQHCNNMESGLYFNNMLPHCNVVIFNCLLQSKKQHQVSWYLKEELGYDKVSNEDNSR